jgi:phosphoglycolate phosphatase
MVLFDLEGTLVDFQWRLQQAVEEILPLLENAGIDTSLYGHNPDYATLYNKTRKIVDIPKSQVTNNIFDKLNLIYDKYDEDALSRWSPYPQTHRMLEKLLDHGIRMGIVSNCGSIAANAVLEKYKLASFFEICLSRNDVSYIKPYPEGLNLALKHLDIEKERVLFVGDSINDIKAAQSVPMQSCFLSGGESAVTGDGGTIGTFQITTLDNLLKLVRDN